MPTSPSSPNNLSLKSARQELNGLNKEIFNLFVQRRHLVERIQDLKAHSSSSFKNFDHQREKELFESLKNELSLLTLLELSAFSLLMEEQAGAPKSYPQWSMAIHLDESPSCAEHRINPILLKIINQPAFETLKLQASFSFLRSI